MHVGRGSLLVGAYDARTIRGSGSGRQPI